VEFSRVPKKKREKDQKDQNASDKKKKIALFCREHTQKHFAFPFSEDKLQILEFFLKH